MTLRIAHITATFPPYRGGTGNVCYHNARELARRGHDVHVFTAALSGAAVREVREGFTIHRLRPLVQVGNAPLLPGLLWVLRGFDVVHLHYPFFGGELATLASRFNRAPLVVTYHQDVHLDGVMGLLAYLLRHTAGRVTLRSAARLLFTSRDYGAASYVGPMLRGREAYLGESPCGVDPAIFHPNYATSDLRVRHNLTDGDRVALMVATLDQAHYFKGVDVFLQALAQLPPFIKGIIVGDGGLRPMYEATARKLGLIKRISFAGRVKSADLPRYYVLADVTVMPSTTMGEAFGLVQVESLASGTPVIVSNLPGVRTVVSPGNDGLLVAPQSPVALAAALRQMLLATDDTTRCAMGQAGHERVKAHYAWEQIGERLERIYQSVCEDTRAGRRIYAQGEQ